MTRVVFEEVSKHYWSRLRTKRMTALDGISLTFESGKVYHIAGHIGAGKSTLARMLIGLEHPTTGSVRIERTDGKKFVCGYLPEDIVLPSRGSVLGCLMYYEAIRGSRGQQGPKDLDAPSLVRRLKLSAFASSRVESIPVGIRRRLQFAIAVVGAPTLVVLDEPFYAFDEAGQQEALAILRELKISGTTIVALSGEFGQFPELTDVSIILRHHKVVHHSSAADSTSPSIHELELSGTTEDVIKRLQKAHTLPSPTTMQQAGYQHRLRFDDYEKSLKWLTSAVASGIIVTKFEEVSSESPRHLDHLLQPEETSK